MRRLAAAERRLKRLLEILVLQAVAYEAQGDRPAAFGVLRQALALGEPEGFVRPFLDGGPAIKRLLRQLHALPHPLPRAGSSPTREQPSARGSYVEALLAAFGSEGASGTDWQDFRPLPPAPRANPARAAGGPPRQPLIEPLSAREVEVLGLLLSGASNQEIAEALVIAASTVKRHVNNIFQKLGVHSRTRACALARALHLGEPIPEAPEGGLDPPTSNVTPLTRRHA